MNSTVMLNLFVAVTVRNNFNTPFLHAKTLCTCSGYTNMAEDITCTALAATVMLHRQVYRSPTRMELLEQKDSHLRKIAHHVGKNCADFRNTSLLKAAIKYQLRW